VTPRLPLEDSTIVLDQQDYSLFVVPEANLIPATMTPTPPLPLEDSPIVLDHKDESGFVVPVAILFDSKHSMPTVIFSRPTDVLHLTWGDSCQSNTKQANCNANCDCQGSDDTVCSQNSTLPLSLPENFV